MSKLWSALSPSGKLLLFMVPLILVTVLFSVSGSKFPGRVPLSSGYSWLQSSPTPSSSDPSTHESVHGTVMEVGPPASVDLEPPRRVAVVGFEKTEEDAVLDSATYSSDSLPPAPAAAIIFPAVENLNFSVS